MESKRSERALELFSRHFNCAQSVFAGFAADDGIEEKRRLALAAPFGGGIARQGEVCGALTGALLVLGDAAGTKMATDPVAGRDAVYEQARRLTEAFRAAHGSIDCRELTGCALDTEERQRCFKERGMHEKLCSKLVASAANLVEEIIAKANV